MMFAPFEQFSPYTVVMVPVQSMWVPCNSEPPACYTVSTGNDAASLHNACATSVETHVSKCEAVQQTKTGPRFRLQNQRLGKRDTSNARTMQSAAHANTSKIATQSKAAVSYDDGSDLPRTQSVTTATSSTMSVVSEATQVLSSEDGFSDVQCISAVAPEAGGEVVPAQLREVRQPRIGIDIGGVICHESPDGDKLQEVPDAIAAVRQIARIFGAEHVFLISRLKLGGSMQQRVMRWLLNDAQFFSKTGVPAGNVVFVSDIGGPAGKGVACAYHGISHFIDDKLSVLQTVMSDAHGNSGHLVRHFNGILFHFSSGGEGRWKPRVPSKLLRDSDVTAHYLPVAGWADVIERLQRSIRMDEQPRPMQQAVTKTAAFCCRISVGIDEDTNFKVVKRLMGPTIGSKPDNFAYISHYSGESQIFLSGRGSGFMPWDDLSICISSRCIEDFKNAISLVEELLADIHAEHEQFCYHR